MILKKKGGDGNIGNFYKSDININKLNKEQYKNKKKELIKELEIKKSDLEKEFDKLQKEYDLKQDRIIKEKKNKIDLKKQDDVNFYKNLEIARRGVNSITSFFYYYIWLPFGHICKNFIDLCKGNGVLIQWIFFILFILFVIFIIYGSTGTNKINKNIGLGNKDSPFSFLTNSNFFKTKLYDKIILFFIKILGIETINNIITNYTKSINGFYNLIGINKYLENSINRENINTIGRANNITHINLSNFDIITDIHSINNKYGLTNDKLSNNTISIFKPNNVIWNFPEESYKNADINKLPFELINTSNITRGLNLNNKKNINIPYKINTNGIYELDLISSYYNDIPENLIPPIDNPIMSNNNKYYLNNQTQIIQYNK